MPPLDALALPEFVPLGGFVGMAEPLHFHLLEFTRAKDEVSRRDLVAEALSDLRDTERNFDARGIDDVLEVKEDSLSRFRAQIGFGIVTLKRADEGDEHQVERARLCERSRRLYRGRDDVAVLIQRQFG